MLVMEVPFALDRLHASSPAQEEHTVRHLIYGRKGLRRFFMDDASAKSPKAILKSVESERVALASAARCAGAPHAGRSPRSAPTSVPDAVSIPDQRQQ